MKKILNTIFLFVSTFLIFSCDPLGDYNGDLLLGVKYNNGSTTTTPTVTKYLNKYKVTDEDGTSEMVYNFVSGKLNTATYQDDDESGNFTLTYDGDTLQKIVIKSNNSGQQATNTINLTYNAGKLISTKSEMVTGTTILSKTDTNYSYASSGKVQKVESTISGEDVSNPGNFVEQMKMISDITFSGSNVSYWKLTTSTVSPIPIPPTVIETTVNASDANRNPFSVFSQAFVLATIHTQNISNSVFGLSSNNYKSVNVRVMNVDQSQSLNYTYDSDKYPKSANIADGGSIIYEYK